MLGSRSGSVWAVWRYYGNDRRYKNRISKLKAHCAAVAYGIARRIIPWARDRRGFFQRHARAEPGMLQQHPQVVPLYISLIAMEWGLFVWVWRGGLRKTGTKLRELIGGKWSSAKDVLVDCGLALGLWAVWTLAELAWNRVFGVGHAASIQTFLPQARIGNSAVGWRFHQRRILRRAGLSRLLSETIRSIHTETLDCIGPAGCAVRNRARLPGNRSRA